MDFKEVLAKVNAKVPLTIGTSTIAGAGRGVFVGADIAAGDLVLSVEKPLLLVVNDGSEKISTTCDNCLVATLNEYKVVARDFEDFFACEKCKVLFYCSKKCKEQAWKEHHHLECPVFCKIQENPGCNAGTPALDRRLNRAIIRLLLLHKNNKISPAVWQSVKSLTINKERMEDKDLLKYSRAAAKLAIAYDCTTLSQPEVVDLIFTMHNNNFKFAVPVLRPQSYQPHEKGLHSVGTCLEPFSSLINHSCIPNAWWLGEGSEYRIRASHDIKAGEELFISYMGTPGEYETRREALEAWNINCVCSLCQKGELLADPYSKQLYDMLRNYGEADGLAPPLHTSKHVVRVLETKGVTLDQYPMHEIHLGIYRAQMEDDDLPEALKTMLKIVYLIDPNHYPPFPMEDRISGLSTLIGLINLCMEDIKTLQDMEIPHDRWKYEVKGLLPLVYKQLRGELVADTIKCFGEDTEIARYQKRSYDLAFGCDAEVEYKKEMDDNLNRLLDWAGINIVLEDATVAT